MTQTPQQNGIQPERSAPATQLSNKPQKIPQRVQTRLSDFFPVRRSDRHTKSEVEAKHQQKMEERLVCNNDVGLPLKVHHFPEKVKH